MIEILVKDKRAVEKDLCDAFLLYPNDEEVKSLVEKYKEVCTDVIDVEKCVVDMVFTDFCEKEGEEMENLEKEEESEEKTEDVENQIPSFSLGLTDSSQENGDNGLNAGIRRNEERVKNVSDQLKSPWYVRAVEINKPMTQEETIVWNYLVKTWQHNEQ